MTRTEIESLLALPIEDLRHHAQVPFRILHDNAVLLEHFALSIAHEIQSRNERAEPTRLILPVGPVAHYRTLVDLCNRERISWKNVQTFNMDELLDWQGRPIPLDHPLSFEGFMQREVFDQLDYELRPPPEQCHFPHPFYPDEISAAIEQAGGIDVCYGGIALNEPPPSRWGRISVDELRDSLTRVVTLSDHSIVVQSIACAGGSTASIPPMAVTLGMRDILASRKIRLYCAGGARHSAIFRITVAGEVSTHFPSTLVQGHPDVEVLTDQATAAPVSIGLLRG